VNLSGPQEDILPRDSIVTMRSLELANKLAAKLKLEPHWISASTPQQALELVQSGKADVAAYSLTDTKARRELVAFTVPLLQSRQKFITSTNGPDISDPKRLRDQKQRH